MRRRELSIECASIRDRYSPHCVFTRRHVNAQFRLFRFKSQACESTVADDKEEEGADEDPIMIGWLRVFIKSVCMQESRVS